MSYTSDCIELLMKEAQSTDETAAKLYPLLQEILAIKDCNHMDIIFDKLTAEVKLFNITNKIG